MKEILFESILKRPFDPFFRFYLLFWNDSSFGGDMDTLLESPITLESETD
jgi:hypothetical protein